MKTYYVYIMTAKCNTVLYTGITNNIGRRAEEHRSGEGSKFTKKYHAKKLVYYEMFEAANEAIAREKQIKGGSRRKKLNLIIDSNPSWSDLAETLG